MHQRTHQRAHQRPPQRTHQHPPQRPHRRTGLVALVVSVLSCVGVYGLVQLYQGSSTPVGSAAPAAAVDGPGSVEPGPAGLATAVTPLGTVVTSDGFTLYRFDQDTAKPPTSTCQGRCASTWPPVLSPTGSAPTITGLDKALVGTVERADGTTQVTLKGWPLYRYSGDKAAMETNGEGVGGSWHAIGVNGKPVSATPPAAPAPTPTPAPAPAPAPAVPAPPPAQEDYPSYGSGGY